MSEIEALFALHVRTAQLPEPVREYRFDTQRRWRFDFAWPHQKVAVECEGGVWTNGRHTRAAGFEADCAKYNTAAARGWRELRLTGGMIKRGTAIDMLIEAMK